MGGRGGGSGGGGGGSIDSLVSAIQNTDNPAQALKLGKQLLNKYANGSSVSVQQDAMVSPERKKSITLGGITLYFGDGEISAPESLVTLINTTGKLPPNLTNNTNAVTLTTQHVPGDPDALASAGDGDKNITVYGGIPISAMTLAHEAAHNFLKVAFTGYNELKATSFADAVEAEPPTYYQNGNAPLAENFCEATALYVLNSAQFKQDFPQTWEAVDQILKDGG